MKIFHISAVAVSAAFLNIVIAVNPTFRQGGIAEFINGGVVNGIIKPNNGLLSDVVESIGLVSTSPSPSASASVPASVSAIPSAQPSMTSSPVPSASASAASTPSARLRMSKSPSPTPSPSPSQKASSDSKNDSGSNSDDADATPTPTPTPSTVIPTFMADLCTVTTNSEPSLSISFGGASFLIDETPDLDLSLADLDEMATCITTGKAAAEAQALFDAATSTCRMATDCTSTASGCECSTAPAPCVKPNEFEALARQCLGLAKASVCTDESSGAPVYYLYVDFLDADGADDTVDATQAGIIPLPLGGGFNVEVDYVERFAACINAGTVDDLLSIIFPTTACAQEECSVSGDGTCTCTGTPSQFCTLNGGPGNLESILLDNC